MKLFIMFLLCFLAFNVAAEQKAVTEEGDIVILRDDGSWFYEEGKVSNNIEIPTNPAVFNTPDSANFALKSKKNNATFTLNTKQWSFEKSTDEDTAIEYMLSLKAGDLYAMAITERIQIDLETLVEIAFDNAKEASPNAKVVKQEYRIVNGKKVIYMEIVGTMQGVEFKYLGYYFSDASGSTQFVVYTGANLVDKFKNEIDNILNGFVVQQ